MLTAIQRLGSGVNLNGHTLGLDGIFTEYPAGRLRFHAAAPPSDEAVAHGLSAISGLMWAEGTLWVGQYRDRRIHQIDPQAGAILRTTESNRFVTGVTWIDGEL